MDPRCLEDTLKFDTRELKECSPRWRTRQLNNQVELSEGSSLRRQVELTFRRRKGYWVVVISPLLVTSVCHYGELWQLRGVGERCPLWSLPGWLSRLEVAEDSPGQQEVSVPQKPQRGVLQGWRWGHHDRDAHRAERGFLPNLFLRPVKHKLSRQMIILCPGKTRLQTYSAAWIQSGR